MNLNSSNNGKAEKKFPELLKISETSNYFFSGREATRLYVVGNNLLKKEKTAHKKKF